MARTGENIYKRKDGRWEGRFIYAYGEDGKAKYKYVCSHFVASMLEKSGIQLFDKESCAVKPNDFFDHEELELEYEGLLNEYLPNRQNYRVSLSSL